MKIRNGFVSNSSSSSFIVAFKTLPQTPEELQAMLFDDEKFYPNPYIYTGDPYGWPAEDVTATVWNDLHVTSERGEYGTPKGIITREEAIEIGQSGYLENLKEPDYPQYDENLSVEARANEWDVYNDKRNAACKIVVDKFLSQVPEGAVLAHFEYSDNDGSYFAALEHGPLFSKLQRLRVSHH